MYWSSSSASLRPLSSVRSVYLRSSSASSSSSSLVCPIIWGRQYSCLTSSSILPCLLHCPLSDPPLSYLSYMHLSILSLASLYFFSLVCPHLAFFSPCAPLSFFFFCILSYFYVGSMFLMRHLHFARSCASSHDNSLSDKSFLMLSKHLRFDLPLLLFPAPPSPSLACPHILLQFSIICPYHFHLLFCTFLHISPTFFHS